MKPPPQTPDLPGHDSHFVVQFNEREHPEGGTPRTLTFDTDFVPRSYDELLAAKPHQKISIQLETHNARIIETNAEGIDIGQRVHFTTPVETTFTATAIGLVQGGWLPSPLAAMRRNAVILPDRNIISEIVGRLGKRRKATREPDFLDLFTGVLL